MPATMWRLTRQAAASSGSADDVFAGLSASHLSLLYRGSRLGSVQGCDPHLHTLVVSHSHVFMCILCQAGALCHSCRTRGVSSVQTFGCREMTRGSLQYFSAAFLVLCSLHRSLAECRVKK